MGLKSTLHGAIRTLQSRMSPPPDLGLSFWEHGCHWPFINHAQCWSFVSSKTTSLMIAFLNTLFTQCCTWESSIIISFKLKTHFYGNETQETLETC